MAGCSAIILLEPRAERRALGLSLGAHHAFDPLEADAATAIKAVEPLGLDYAFDTSGNLAAIMAAISVLKTKGVMGLVGVPAQIDAVLPLPLVPAILNGLTVMGITEGDSAPQEFIPELVALHASGRLPFDRFVTTYPFEDINAAMEDAHQGRCIKAVLLLDT